eukprot:SAG31_NODE_572_length_13974_cov_28.935640_5_plen_175_part_00
MRCFVTAPLRALRILGVARGRATSKLRMLDYLSLGVGVALGLLIAKVLGWVAETRTAARRTCILSPRKGAMLQQNEQYCLKPQKAFTFFEAALGNAIYKHRILVNISKYLSQPLSKAPAISLAISLAISRNLSRNLSRNISRKSLSKHLEISQNISKYLRATTRWARGSCSAAP